MTSQVQECLQSVNATQIKLIKEFGQVYSALEALDKDYIQAILISIKATEKTSEGIQETQGQIGKIVENQRKTLEELKKFKQKLDGYAHLGDIDKCGMIARNGIVRWGRFPIPSSTQKSQRGNRKKGGCCKICTDCGRKENRKPFKTGRRTGTTARNGREFYDHIRTTHTFERCR